MTDKELKKLSRLELLELLLTESRENERLREELAKAKQENTIEKSAQHLNETSKQLEAALKKVNSLMDVQGTNTQTQNDINIAPVKIPEAEESNTLSIAEKARAESDNENEYVDFNLYKSLIIFFIQEPDSLNVLPEDIREAITNRIIEISGTLKTKTQK